MFGVIALFDKNTENTIKEIWKELSEKKISFYAEEVEDRRPHITLASYNCLNISDFTMLVDKYYEKKDSIDISFNTIGSFLNSGTLFFSPTVTKELIQLHSNFHEYFEEFNDNPNSLYLPVKWIPHCTIANRLSQDKLTEAFNYCSKRNNTIHGNINEIALIELIYENGICVKAPIIHSKILNMS